MEADDDEVEIPENIFSQNGQSQQVSNVKSQQSLAKEESKKSQASLAEIKPLSNHSSSQALPQPIVQKKVGKSLTEAEQQKPV